ncbi:MAG: MlaE family lipid ABC transporter permease subunit [Chromatiales bacterium]|jgi:phospholipid/cholesterol/gamma-HCH transport system permease protein
MSPSDRKRDPASFDLEGSTLRCRGSWTLGSLHRLERGLEQLAPPDAGALAVDMQAVERIDTAGAWLLFRTLRRLEAANVATSIQGLSEQGSGLLDLIRREASELGEPPEVEQPGVLEALGRGSLRALGDTLGFAAFIGEVAVSAVSVALRPRRIRFRATMTELAQAGYKALPILGLLSFLLGIVIAYQGGVQLRQYGASVFIADLVGLSMIRELAPLMTAIIVAGRTGSAYTAEIGTMKVTEEVDALRTIGIPPMEILVLPKVFALLLALPLLTVYADIMGIFGGMVMAGAQLDVTFSTFLDRLTRALTLESYLIGVGKAPVFAAIVASVGCFQGLQVSGSAESVGRRTTVSVVHSIIAVIIVDAIFSIIFSWLEL